MNQRHILKKNNIDLKSVNIHQVINISKLQEYTEAKLKEQEMGDKISHITLDGTKRLNAINQNNRSNINIFTSYQPQRPPTQQSLTTSLKQRPSQMVSLEATVQKDPVPKFMCQLNEHTQQQLLLFVEKIRESLSYQQKRFYEWLIQQFAKLSDNKLKQIQEVYKYKHKVSLQDDINNIQTPLYKTTLTNMLMDKKSMLVKEINNAIESQNLPKLITYIFLYSEDDMQQVLQLYQQYTNQNLFSILDISLEDGYCKQIILHYLKSLVQEQHQILINNEEQFIVQLIQYLERHEYQQFLATLLGISNHIYPQISLAIWMKYQRPLNEILKQHFQRFDLECLLMFHEHKNGYAYGMAYTLHKAAQTPDIDEVTKIALLIKGEPHVEQAYKRMFGDIQQLLSTYHIVNAILQFKQPE